MLLLESVLWAVVFSCETIFWFHKTYFAEVDGSVENDEEEEESDEEEGDDEPLRLNLLAPTKEKEKEPEKKNVSQLSKKERKELKKKVCKASYLETNLNSSFRCCSGTRRPRSSFSCVRYSSFHYF